MGVGKRCSVYVTHIMSENSKTAHHLSACQDNGFEIEPVQVSSDQVSRHTCKPTEEEEEAEEDIITTRENINS